MNRRDFIATSAAVCLAPALPALPDLRPVLIWYDPFYYEWIAARSLDEARQCLVAECCYLEEDAAKWDGYAIDATACEVRNEDGTPSDMATRLERELREGVQVPYCFANEY